MPRLRRRLGIVFQDFRLLEDRTAEENVAFALEVTGARRDTIAARVMRVLTQVGLVGQEPGLPPRALRRRAAARRHRARAGERPRDPGGRRAHRQPRRARHPRRLPAAPRHQRRRHRRGHGHPRPRPRPADAATAPSSCARARWSTTARVDEADATEVVVRLLTREALLSFRRAPLLSALSITTIAFSLFTVGLFGLVAINLRQALRGIEERVEIVAFVLRGHPGRDDHPRHPGHRGLSRGAGRRAS